MATRRTLSRPMTAPTGVYGVSQERSVAAKRALRSLLRVLKSRLIAEELREQDKVRHEILN